jgi:hypothetical protein
MSTMNTTPRYHFEVANDVRESEKYDWKIAMRKQLPKHRWNERHK